MPIVSDNYSPKYLYRFGHGNTFLTYFLRKPKIPNFVRQRVDTPDGDFLNLDWLKNKNKRLSILCHGLEGDTDSQYIRGMTNALALQNWDVLAWNYRTCGGEMNNTLRLYTSGDTRDLSFLIDRYAEAYDEIALIGFSLGGNLVMKYTGTEATTDAKNLIGTVGISVPTDLSASSNNFTRPANYLYEKRFLISLFAKVRYKKKQFPEKIDLSHLKKTKSILDFDEYYTAPLNGFENGEDYYQKSSSKQFLPNINTPALMINALDDPFLHPLCFPKDEAEVSSFFHLMIPKFGGHVGFGGTGSDIFWSEMETLKFLNSQSKLNS